MENIKKAEALELIPGALHESYTYHIIRGYEANFPEKLLMFHWKVEWHGWGFFQQCVGDKLICSGEEVLEQCWQDGSDEHPPLTDCLPVPSFIRWHIPCSHHTALGSNSVRKRVLWESYCHAGCFRHLSWIHYDTLLLVKHYHKNVALFSC